MWRIVVREHGDPAWRAIWTATGRRAEADANVRFTTIRALLAGAWDEEHNAHAYAWVSARLMRGDLIVAECDRHRGADHFTRTDPPPPRQGGQ